MKNEVIKEMPLELRPRERLMRYGANLLSDYELLAIILRTGTKEVSVLELARRVIIKFKNLGELKNITVRELCEVKGIKEAKVNIAGKEINIAVAHGLKNVRKLLEDVRDGKSKYHFIEVMTCPGGCIMGGGQPIRTTKERAF